ncbi:Disease resistance-like protein DSC1 [Citrus sinensis]|uniref:Disease resistance-like protein DSC1 n=1 Tax=Citrus sinensis TaxID=2711 RepID=A0ACB8MC80_CITSI|nr:Disease resistance-like protein DSC1 [Citrus sinensis]
MASLVSSRSSCIATQYKYDVFLSFRGEDTRDNFTSHLYAALCRKKVETFIDEEELEIGDEISPALLMAINASKIAVIIFSKHYASSKWCLNELVEILQSQKTNGQMVIPVFYHVNPSYVRKQTGSFGEAFAEHESRFREMPEKVQKWRDVLTEASNLSGWDSMNIRPEAKLVDEIVKDILRKLEHISPSIDSKGLVGLDSRIEQIKSLLCMGLSDFRVIGIWGMGGIGKTTLAGTIFNQISCEFEGKCFMANVREESEKSGGLVHLREQVLSQILEENLKIGAPTIPLYIKERLKQMKVFIVLDDVNSFRQLEYLAGGVDDYGPGSRIIVTTRDKQVLENFGVDNIYSVDHFTHDEALELFCNHAFRQNTHPHDLMVLSTRVVDYAKGNPLALKVLGSFFYGRRKVDWENALHNLKRISDRDVYEVLKISYDELNWEEKNIFLDIACFFKGEYKDYVTRIQDDPDFVRYVLNVLVNKSLITISSYNKLEMHDLLEEMGREIVRCESVKEPGKRSRLWHHEDIYHVLKKNKGTDSIEGIFLDMSKIREIHLSSRAFACMTNLRMLKFYVPKLSKLSDVKVHLHNGLDYLSDELRYLHWHGYPLKTLPSNFSPENLIELNLPYSKVEQMWEGKKESFKLKWIDLHHCQYLIRFPDPLETPNLERICLSDCIDLPCIPSSIENFNNLSILCLQGCESLRRFPSNIHFRSPITLDFSDCLNLTEFPQFSGNIKQLYLCGTAIEEVPSSVECLTELAELYMRQCTRLKSISSRICKLKSLHLLSLDDCCRLERFPEITETMECLEYFSLASTTIQEQPSSIEGRILPSSIANWSYGCRGLILPPLPGLSSLTWLNLSFRNITEIPKDIGCLSSLRTLDLRGNNFASLPASIKQFTQMEELILSNCNLLQSLPELPPSLILLEARNCKQLQSLPELSSYLEELDASKLETLSEYSDVFAQPRITFTFTNCLKLNRKAYNILADSELRMQHMATASLRLFYEKVFDVPPQFSICLPGNGIPDWFSYQSLGTSITIQLPQCNRRFIGLALSVVIEFEEVFYGGYSFGVRCEYQFETETLSGNQKGNWVCYLTSASDYKVEDLLIYSNHVLLGFDPCLNIQLPDGDLHATATFHFSLLCDDCITENRIGCKVKRIGVCPLTANTNETKSKIFTENSATSSEEECTKIRKFHNVSDYHKVHDWASAKGKKKTNLILFSHVSPTLFLQFLCFDLFYKSIISIER